MSSKYTITTMHFIKFNSFNFLTMWIYNIVFSESYYGLVNN